jgi:LCP family protein required for cell wall assembly
VREKQSSQRYRVYRGGRASRDDPEAARFDFAGGASTASPRRTPAGMSAPPMAPGRDGAPRRELPGRQVYRAEGGASRAAPPGTSRRRFGLGRFGWGKRIALGVGLIVLLLGGWMYLGYRAFSEEVEKANRRITPQTRAALTPADAILFNPQITLIAGSDSRGAVTDTGQRADSILLMRTDPDKGLLSLLSIPRDLRVPIPGSGENKINAAFSFGGPPLLIRTVNALTGFRINHIVLVNFSGFRDLVDSLGGIDIRSPRPVVSSRPFDGYKWRFPKGDLHLDGRRALAYARIRYTTNPADTDVSRTKRQQQVMQAIAQKLASPSSVLNLPSVGRDIAKPLATDLSANQLIGLGWLRFRASRTLQCHLGGTPASVDGQSVLLSDERNRAIVNMFLGRTAPQPQPPGELFAPGCDVR